MTHCNVAGCADAQAHTHVEWWYDGETDRPWMSLPSAELVLLQTVHRERGLPPLVETYIHDTPAVGHLSETKAMDAVVARLRREVQMPYDAAQPETTGLVALLDRVATMLEGIG